MERANSINSYVSGNDRGGVEIVSPTLTGEFSLINGVLYKKKKNKRSK